MTFLHHLVFFLAALIVIPKGLANYEKPLVYYKYPIEEKPCDKYKPPPVYKSLIEKRQAEKPPIKAPPLFVLPPIEKPGLSKPPSYRKPSLHKPSAYKPRRVLKSKPTPVYKPPIYKPPVQSSTNFGWMLLYLWSVLYSFVMLNLCFSQVFVMFLAKYHFMFPHFKCWKEFIPKFQFRLAYQSMFTVLMYPSFVSRLHYDIILMIWGSQFQ